MPLFTSGIHQNKDGLVTEHESRLCFMAFWLTD